MTVPRSSIINDAVVGVYHCFSRCVRGAFLCGYNKESGKSFNHRRQWIEQRLENLANYYFIDVCSYAILDNHFHVILRNRPDLVNDSSKEELAHRWWRLTSKGRNTAPTEKDIEAILKNPDLIGKIRQRLSSISWFMSSLKGNIARRANLEDGCKGHFWEGRFKSVSLLDDAAILCCLVYIALNPIRANLAKTPEASEFTSVKKRIEAFTAQKRLKYLEENRIKSPDRHHAARIKTQSDSWLCPLMNKPNRQGFLDLDFDSYLEILDWSGRNIVDGKTGAIPDHLSPILARLEVNHQHWLATVRKFPSLFFRCAGTPDHMTEVAKNQGKKWLKGITAGRVAFSLN